MSGDVIHSTQGPYYVRPTVSMSGVNSECLTICAEVKGEVIATVPPRGGRPNYADAALLSASPHMLEALIAIQERIFTAKEVIDLNELNEIISRCFEKIHAEADA